jgi:hypothetical protein
MFIPLIMLHAMSAYVGYTLEDDEAKAMQKYFEITSEEIMRIYNEVGGDTR